MFEYDRLSLDLTSTLTRTKNTQSTADEHRHAADREDARRSKGSSGRCAAKSFSPPLFHSEPVPAAKFSFDCGASSGYGSPGAESTPLASPALDESAPSSFDILGDLERMLLADDEPPPLPTQKQRNTSWPRATHCGIPIHAQSASTTRKASVPSYVLSEPFHSISDTDIDRREATPLAQEDGFSSAEIEQFAQLLASPKKTPPANYQCHICSEAGHYINDCPARFNSPFDDQRTPYQGRKKCYGEFQCQQCKRKWTSQNSVANEAQTCIKCHIAVYPHKQLPVDKALAMGLVKSQHLTPSPPQLQQRYPAPKAEHLRPFAMSCADGGEMLRTK